MTPVTAKHRIFTFVDGAIIPDDALISIATSDAFALGVLSSRLHATWALAAGGTLEDRPRYLKSVCFDPFPFPSPTPAQRGDIAGIAEDLDSHRKACLAQHPFLTLTALYNVLVALRTGRPLTEVERDIHDAGQISILRTLHDRLDAAVAAAYRWPASLSDAENVARIADLNAERVAEEAEGNIRWLRPEFQAPEEVRRKAMQRDIAMPAASAVRPWPNDAPAQFVELRRVLTRGPVSAGDLASNFKGAPRGRKLAEMLATLAALGQAREISGGRYIA